MNSDDEYYFDEDEEYESNDEIEQEIDWDDCVVELPKKKETKSKAPKAGKGKRSDEKKNEKKARRNPDLKVEKTNLILSNENRNMIMDSLRFIHGQNFSFDDTTVEKNKRALGNQYWMDQGQLVVCGVYDYSNRSNEPSEKSKVNSGFLEKLERYGFYTNHCIEALLKCNNDVEEALLLLYSYYFGVQYDTKSELPPDFSQMEDEIVALESIYDDIFEVQEGRHWCFRLRLPRLASWHMPDTKPSVAPTLRHPKPLCRLYANTGTCRFGIRCRYSHDKPKVDPAVLIHDEERNKFRLEVRFPKGCQYPKSMPVVLFLASHKEFSSHLCLRITKLLIQESRNCLQQEMPCCYNLIDLLFNTEEVIKWLGNKEHGIHVDPKVPMFRGNHEPVNYNDDVQKGPAKVSKSGQYMKPLSSSKPTHSVVELVQRMKSVQSSQGYKKMQKFRQQLPAWNAYDEIMSALDISQVVVIVGETGCGKSTQIPQFIIDDWLSFASREIEKNSKIIPVNIICTQPRRLSAIGVADRVANERGEKLGDTVGYQIRLESCCSSYTRLMFCTIGILLRKMKQDPFLDSVTHIIVDEVHERSEESDFLLMILKDLLNHKKNIRILLMSATVNSKLFSSYFNGAPVVTIPGKMFPVTDIFLEDMLEMCGYSVEENSKMCRNMGKNFSRDMDSLMADLTSADLCKESSVSRDTAPDDALSASQLFYRYSGYSFKTRKTLLLMDTEIVDTELIISVLCWIVNGDHEYPRKGSILVFLPGIAEITSLYDELCGNSVFAPRYGKFIIIPLHSSISTEDQSAIFQKPKEGVRKVVLSTNIAETSVTIDDCVFVIDTGKMKETRFDTDKNMSSLETTWITRANAQQRKGRAGRVMPGVCVRLYTSHRHNFVFKSQPIPEIRRSPLDQIILQIKTLPPLESKSIHEILANIIEAPDEISIVTAINRLKDVGALDEDQKLTALGRHLSALPVDVKLGKLILFGAVFCCLDSVLTIAASLSNKSLFISPFHKREEADKRRAQFVTANSDHLTVLKAYKKWHEKASYKRFEGKRFAEENFLSWKTLESMADLKHQFLELLISIGFVSDIDTRRRFHEDRVLLSTGRSLNVNGENNNLLAAIVCAALYPNLVKIFTPGKLYTQTASGSIPKTLTPSELKLKTKNDGYVFLHPSSVIYKTVHFPSPYLVFQEKIKTSKIFLHNNTMVSALSLVLFAGSEFKIEFCSGSYTISLEGGWLVFFLQNLDDAKMLQHMRIELSKLLEKKIEDPKMNLATDDVGKRIISTIVRLISVSK